VENHKEFNGVNFSSTRARTNVIASFNFASKHELAIAINLVLSMSAKK